MRVKIPIGLYIQRYKETHQLLQLPSELLLELLVRFHLRREVAGCAQGLSQARVTALRRFSPPHLVNKEL